MKEDQRNGGRGGREKGETDFHCVDHGRPSLLQASGLMRMWVQTANLASGRDRTSHSAWCGAAFRESVHGRWEG